MSTSYHGVYDHDTGTCVITVERNGSKTHLVHRVLHSPTGFQWGYSGSGPADTARSILWDYMGREPNPALYQAFKFDVVAKFPQSGNWTLSGDKVKVWLDEHEELNVKPSPHRPSVH
jgi:hypothetical protein